MSKLNSEGTFKAVARPVEVDGLETYVQFGMTKGGEGKEPKKQVAINFELLEGPDAGERMVWFGYFSDATWERTVESLRYCGFKGDDLSDVVNQKLNQEVSIVVKHEEYQGETKARVAWVNKARSGFKMTAPMANKDLALFASAMKSRVARVPAVEADKVEEVKKPTPLPSGDAGAKSASGAGTPLKGDDDCPF